MDKKEKIELFMKTFSGRKDVIPRFWISKDRKKTGYSPICNNEWHDQRCQKAHGKPCRTCKSKAYVPWSTDWIRRHLLGVDILGVYPLLPNNTCNFIAGDFDDHNDDRNPLADIKSFYEVCQVQEIPCYILRSKSGRGYHTYILFNKPAPAWKARAVNFALLGEACVIDGDAKLSSFDRLFPNQDRCAGGGIGNLIALPLQRKARKKGHTLFLDPNTGFKDPFPDQWDILSKIKRIDESVLDNLIKEWDLEPKKHKSSGAVNPDGWLIEVLKGVDKGVPGRDSTGAKIAGYFIDKLPKKDILSILLAWNSHNRPPLEQGAIRKIVDSVERYKKGNADEWKINLHFAGREKSGEEAPASG